MTTVLPVKKQRWIAKQNKMANEMFYGEHIVQGLFQYKDVVLPELQYLL